MRIQPKKGAVRLFCFGKDTFPRVQREKRRRSDAVWFMYLLKFLRYFSVFLVRIS